MKILFVVKSKAIEVLGAMYLAAVCKQHGHKARIVQLEEAYNEAMLWKPDIVGMSVMTGDQGRFIQLAEELHEKIHPTILFGGAHSSLFPDDFVRSVGTVVRGEAEQFMADMFRQGIQYPNINDIPFPDRTDFPNQPIRDFITSRGCPWGECTYCYSKQWDNLHPGVPSLRVRSVENVIKELKSVPSKFNYMQDACFGIDIKWLRSFSEQYKNECNVPYHCQLRPTQCTEERIKLLHDSNCVSLRIALESASQKLRTFMKRGKMSLEDVIKSVNLVKKYGIKIMVQNMIGIPTGNISDDLDTLEFNVRCQPDYSWVSIYSPYPGTELGNYCKNTGLYSGDYSDISDSFFDTTVLNFTELYKEQVEVLQKIFALCVMCNYLPKETELTYKEFPKLIHKITRHYADRNLYYDYMH